MMHICIPITEKIKPPLLLLLLLMSRTELLKATYKLYCQSTGTGTDDGTWDRNILVKNGNGNSDEDNKVNFVIKLELRYLRIEKQPTIFNKFSNFIMIHNLGFFLAPIGALEEGILCVSPSLSSKQH